MADRYVAPRSRSRAGRRLSRDAGGVANGERSTSRGSFLGRNRAPVLLGVSSAIGEDSYASEQEDNQEDERRRRRTRWTSVSPTVRGSVSVERKAARSKSRGRSSVVPKDQVAHSTPQDLESGESKHKLSRAERLPWPLPVFLGFRKPDAKPLLGFITHLHPTLEIWLWAFVGSSIPLALITLLFSHAVPFREYSLGAWAAPSIIGSFGASSVLVFGTPASPLAQPWNFVAGQTISAVLGVAVTKLFELSVHYRISEMQVDNDGGIVWVAGGIATACALVAMFIIGAVHPPGGATALLAATSPAVVKLGWRYIPIVLLTSAIMLVWALFFMNLGRSRYPTAWVPDRDARIHSAWGLVERRNERRAKKNEEEEEGRERKVERGWLAASFKVMSGHEARRDRRPS